MLAYKQRQPSSNCHACENALGNSGLLDILYSPARPYRPSDAGTTPLQRVIDFSKKPVQLPHFQTWETFINGMAEHFGEAYRDLITRMAAMLDESEATVTLDEAYHRIVRNIQAAPPLGYSKTQESAYNQLSFTSVTRASMTSSGLSTPIVTRNDKRGHAERLAIAMFKSIPKIEASVFQMTINNSPCQACAKALAAWVKETGNELTIRFCNCYGKAAEFMAAVKVLRDAGIKLHTFDLALLHPGWIAVKYSSRMKNLKKRLIAQKERSGFESDQEEDMLPPSSSGIADLSLNLWRQETGSDIYTADGFEYTPNHPHVRDGGECFWDSLRRYSISEANLAQAAKMTGIQVDQHVNYADTFQFIRNLGIVMHAPFALLITEFNYGDPRPQGTRLEGNGYVIRLAYYHMASEADGHFVPPMRY